MNDKEFFENKEGCGSQIVNREEAIKEVTSKDPKAVKTEIDEMFNEVASVMGFVKDRFTEIIDKHESLSAVGNLGMVMGATFYGRPVVFAGIGTKEALDNTLRVVLQGVASNED